MVPASIVSGMRPLGFDGLVLVATLVVTIWCTVSVRRERLQLSLESEASLPIGVAPPPDEGASSSQTAGILAGLRTFAASARALCRITWTVPALLVVLAATGQISSAPGRTAHAGIAVVLAAALGALLLQRVSDRRHWIERDWRTPARTGIGVALIVAAHLIARASDPVLLRFALSGVLERRLHVAIDNLDNVLLGVISAVVGGILVSRGIALTKSGRVKDSDAALSVPPRMRDLIRRGGRRPLAAAGALLAAVCWRLADGRSAPWEVVAWIGGLVLLTFAAHACDRAAGTPVTLGLARIDIVALLGLIASGLAVGVFRLATAPDSLMGDEGAFWTTALEIARGRQHPSIFGLGVYSFPVFSSYGQAAVLRVTGENLWGWRFGSALPAVLGVVPTYLLAKELFGRRVAATSGTLLVTTPFFLAFARLGYNNAQSILPVTLTLFLAYAGLQRRSALFLCGAGIAAGFGFSTFTAARLGLVVVALFFGRLALMRRMDRRTADAPADGLPALGVVFATAWAATAAPFLLYGNATDPVTLRVKLLESAFPNAFYARSIFPDAELFRDHAPFVIDGQTFFFRPDLYGILIGRGVVRTLLSFNMGGLVHEHFIVGALAGPLGAVLLAIGIAVAVAR